MIRRQLFVPGITGLIVSLCLCPRGLFANATDTLGGLPHVAGSRTQHNWSLVRVFAACPDPHIAMANGLEIQAPDDTDAAAPNYGKAISIFACTPSGDRFPLNVWPGKASKSQKIRPLYCPVPDVPASCPYIDVVIARKGVVEASWRVTNLSHLTHHVLGVPKTTLRLASSDLSVSGRCWWSGSSPCYPLDVDGMTNPLLGVEAEIRLQNSRKDGSNTGYWSADDVTLTTDWGSPPGNMSCGTASGSGHTLASIDISGMTEPFPSFQHLLKVSGVLKHHDSVSETVDFKDVPLRRRGSGWCIDTSKSLKKRSANGVMVTFAPRTGLTQPNEPARSEGKTRLAITYMAQRIEDGDQRESPLYKKYHQPVKVSVSSYFEGDHKTTEISEDDVDTVYLDEAPDKALRGTLHVTLLEDTIVNSYPFVLTMPIEKRGSFSKIR